ncbi:MAG: superoxide dismutase [Fe] [Gammaproteobacteria bacterium]|nr:superoxide dismutase [Fe] [Gammaproteobacteria bacterium]
MIELMELPYKHDALEPHISAETIDYHYLKHHKTYVDNLNTFISQNAGLAGLSLEEIIRREQGPIFNNAAQVWNHDFYWNCLGPNAGGDPEGILAKMIIAEFESIDRFRKLFTEVALKTFGSGWAWLTLTHDGHLEIISTSNAMTPLVSNRKALLTCDVWEHAYYIDYRNLRGQYLDSFWKCVNWQAVAKNLTI